MFFLLQDQARFSHNYFSTTRYFSAGIDDSSYNCSFVLCNKANLICTSYVCFWDMLWFSVCPSSHVTNRNELLLPSSAPYYFYWFS